MTPNEYQKLAYRTAPSNYSEVLMPSDKTACEVIHAKLGIDSESGELADAIKKCLIYKQPMDLENIKEECGDLLWYIALLLTATGFDMEECMQVNIDKLKIRYPEKFTEKLAKERRDKQ